MYIETEISLLQIIIEGAEENMNRKEYEKTDDYIESIEIIKGFIREMLDGDIEKMRDLDFADLTKYISNSIDPDMILFVQTVYIVLWGDLYDLTFDKMGPWSSDGKHPFRGDTMNSFKSVFGEEGKDTEFAYRAKFFGADKNEVLWKKIREFHKVYHKLGNFIVLPNRAAYENGINGARGCYYDNEKIEAMRDYFDWFLVAVSDYQNKLKRGDSHFTKFETYFNENLEYDPSFLEIKDWEERFFLQPYFEKGKPVWLFETPSERRTLITAAPENRRGKKYYQDEEYLKLMEDYLDKSKAVIEFRTEKMIDCLQRKLAKQER